MPNENPESPAAKKTIPGGSGRHKSIDGPIMRFFKSFLTMLAERQILYKVITLLFALLVFGFVYLQMEGYRNILTYMGLMLLMVLVYVEILIIRDHLWVIEGSMRESRKWRDVFFNQTTLKRQRIRKIFSVLFALAIFSYVYMKVPKVNSPVLSFMGIILMITMLYYEILTIRDDVLLMRQALAKGIDDGDEGDRKVEYEQFIQTDEDTSKTPSASDARAEPVAPAKNDAADQPPQK